AGARAFVFVVGAGPAVEQKLDSDVEVVWLHRGDRPVGRALVEAVRALDFPEGRLHAFVHGEAACVKELRRYLRVEREIPREDLSISGYWRLGHNEDGWQASKREWNARIEAEQETDATAA
ncbi:siderophore-interacting protein, partial [Streptomyces olivaceus]|uniref:siderophore-interacting protein n=1 Tax=Streptomyces olivaceus TaxID=47716 RepID=UPI003656ADC5